MILMCFASILDPGQVPEIRSVMRSGRGYPSAPLELSCTPRYSTQVAGDAKIPTIIYYDANGTACAVGAEAMREGLHELVEDEGWTKTEWCVIFVLLGLQPAKTRLGSSCT